jgi:hypothetical protein
MAVVNPVQYGAGMVQPGVDLAQFTRGMAVGQGLTDAVDVMKQRQMAQQQAQQNMAIQAAQRAALLDLEQAPSSEKARSILLRFPGLKDQVGGFMSSLNEDEKKARLSQMTEATGFLTSGDVEGAKQAFLRSAQAYENAGRPQDAEPLRRLAEQVEANPDAVRAQLQLRIEAVDPEAGKRLTEFEKAREETRKAAGEASIKETQAMAEYDRLAAEINLSREQAKRLRTQSYVDAARLGLDRERLALDRLKAQQERLAAASNLSEPAQKRVVDASDKAVKAAALAAKAGELATRFEGMAAQGVMGGRVAMVGERVKQELGMEDAVSQARAQYEEIKTSQVLASLPPGAASDTDIALASKPLPAGTSDPKIVASYLRGLEKINRFSEVVAKGEADYVSQNGNVGMAKQNMVVGGVQVPQGATYGEVLEALQRRALRSAVPAPVATPAPTGSRRTGSGRVGQ